MDDFRLVSLRGVIGGKIITLWYILLFINKQIYIELFIPYIGRNKYINTNKLDIMERIWYSIKNLNILFIAWKISLISKDSITKINSNHSEDIVVGEQTCIPIRVPTLDAVGC